MKNITIRSTAKNILSSNRKNLLLQAIASICVALPRTAVLAIATICVAQQAYALPVDDSNMNVDVGAASYSFDGFSETGTLTFEQNNSMVTFTESVNISTAQILLVNPGASGDASWVGVLRDNSGSASFLEGTLDANMRVFFLNPNGVLAGNDFSIDFASLGSNSGAVLLSTHSIDQQLLAQGQYSLVAAGGGAAITVEGLQLAGSGAQLALLADKVNINGVVDAAGSKLEAVSAGMVEVVFGLDDMIAVRAPLAVAGINAGIDVANTATVNAHRVRLAAAVDDPLSLALNNRGMISASGISVNEQGQVTLIAEGGRVISTGSLDTRDTINGDGDIFMSGNTVILGGSSQAGQGQINVTVGDAVTGAKGEFLLLGNASVSAAGATLAGVGQSNSIIGLANYRVTGSNSGDAGWIGVGASDWQNQNNGTVSFSGFDRLIAQPGVENLFRIEDAGSLTNGGNALLRGGARADRFEIAGNVDLLEGNSGDDTFVMQGGRVNGLVDGGRGIDGIENVFTVTRRNSQGDLDPQGINGSSDFVDWVNIQNVLELPVPEPEPLPIDIPDLSSLQASQVSFVNVNNLTAVSLGVVGGAEPRLPCGFGGTAGSMLAADIAAGEDPCFDEKRLEQFRHLISSLVHFDHDSAVINPAFAARLAEVANYFVGSQQFGRVQIAAHTDDVGPETYNLALAERRARSTAAFLQARGVRGDLIETFHFGEALPAVPNTSAENRAYNRRARVELKR
ncbi:MAG: OmpA family protein [Pseudomonadales bacterium]